MKKIYSFQIIENVTPGFDLVITREKTTNLVEIEWLPHEETAPHFTIKDKDEGL